MTLQAGLRLGPYEVVAPAGAGGMGEVYRARDTRLQRTVALKILPSTLASGAGARERFEREAKAISALSHPHICALYDVGRDQGLDYLVLEFLEGETLADRLGRGPLPMEQALRFGAQIASALGAAHRRGIVHRDLKPGNVMLTPAGVKLLDFGLAKPAPSRVSPGGGSDSEAATRTGLTQEGVVPGTVPYMAPEQIEGEAVDARTDIFALGAVLYEMTTGRRAFQGKSTASLMAAILERDPDSIAALRPRAPEGLDHIVRVCLAKRPEDRWQNADDVSRELAWIARPERDLSGRPGARPGAGPLTAAAAVLLVAGALLGWLGARIAGTSSPTSDSGAGGVQSLSIVLPEAAPLAPPAATPFGYLRPSFAVAPDDSSLAYVSATGDGATRIVLRRSDRYEPEPIAGTEGGFDPFFSPDGRWIGFFTFDALRKVSIDGGAPLTIAAIVNPVGGTWCDDGTLYVAGDEGATLWRISASDSAAGGKAVRVDLDATALSAYPQCLPGSRALLLTMAGQAGEVGAPGEPVRFRHPLSADLMSVGVLDLPPEGRTPRPLIPRGYAPQYAMGRLLFARSGTLMVAPFDVERASITGAETAAVDGVSMCSIAVPAAQYTFTAAGSLFLVPGVDQGRTRLVWVDRRGRVTPTAAAPDLFGTLTLSSEGRRAAAEVGGLQDDVYVYDLATGRRTRITSDGRGGRRGMWHPDARRIVFFSERDHRWMIRPAERDVAPEPLDGIDGYFTSWSAPGTLAGERDGHIWLGTRERQSVITSSGAEWGARISPDGRFVAYTSARTGVFLVYVQPIPATGQEWQVSVDFGEEPVWAHDSRELFYRKHDQWWSVPFVGGTPEAARPLFRGPFLNALGPSYDVAPDGRFLMALPPAPGPVRELRWIRNGSGGGEAPPPR